MSALRRLVGEAHRRSLWQVLSIYLAVSWGVLQVVEVVAESVGLPDWTQGFAFVLLLIGLPIVMATAFIQEGMPGGGAERGAESPGSDAPTEAQTMAPGTGSLDLPSTRPRAHRRLFTWRNAMLGGAAAFGVLGLSLAAYAVMWSTGFGPVGNLLAQGVIEEGDEIVLAEFENTSDDPSLGGVVTEALRVDLAGAENVRLVKPDRVRATLGLMGEEPEATLTSALAREVAVREGVKAVLRGEVGSAGTGYILVATLEAAATGEPLATFRRTAGGPDEVIQAIDKLSQDVRERTGESLRRIKAEEPLEAYTTSSLEALRKYSEAEREVDSGDARRARTLLEEAIELDPDFAMAWRKLSVVMQSAGGTQAEMGEAATRAWELRDRLTDVERYLAAAYYHNRVTKDVDAQADAYRAVLAQNPDEPTSLNNLATALAERTRYAEAVELLDRAVNGPGRSAPAQINLPMYLALGGDTVAAREALTVLEERIPVANIWTHFTRSLVAAVRGDLEAAHRSAEDMGTSPDAPVEWKSFAEAVQAMVDAGRGRLDEARGHVGSSSDDAAREGRWEDAFRPLVGMARLEELVAGTSGKARESLGRALADGWLDSIAPAGRPYPELVEALAVTGSPEKAREILGHWRSAESSGATGTPLRDADAIVAVFERAADDPAGAASDLEAFRRGRGCPRCFTWELSELRERSGDREGAAALLDELVGAPEDWEVGPAQTSLVHEWLGAWYDERGDTARALEHWRAFAERWAGADPELQPRVRHARERVAALGG